MSTFANEVLSSDDAVATAWAAGKSPLPFQIRRFLGRSGNEETILIDRGVGPAFFPAVFITCCYTKTGKAANTRFQALKAIGMARAWASARGRDLDAEIRHGAFISSADAEAIADHVTLDVEAQVRANELASQVSQRPKKVGGLERFRPHPTEQGVQVQSASPVEVAARIGYVAEYVEWLLAHRISFSDGDRAEVQALRETGKQVVARLRQRRTGSGSQTNPDEALEGVSQDVVELVSAALLPDAPENPFQPGFIRARNQLMWHLYISTGGRREEVLSVLVKDIIFSSRRLTISKSKTKVRTVSISGDAAQLFVRFIDVHWARLPRAARRRGFLFTAANGAPLSCRAVNRVFETIRASIPGVSAGLTPHSVRRHWNDRFSELVDRQSPEKRMPVEQEMRARNMLQGWSPNSAMGARYAARHLRRKADALGEQLADEIANEVPEPAND